MLLFTIIKSILWIGFVVTLVLYVIKKNKKINDK